MLRRNMIGLMLTACGGVSVASGQAIHADFMQIVGDPQVSIVREVAVTPFFDQQVAIGAYPGFIAVFVDPAHRAQTQLRTVLDAAGLVGVDVQQSTVPGWAYVKLNAGDLESAEQSVAALAARDDVDMASLMYIGEGDLPVIPTRDLLVSFADHVMPAEQEAILAAFDVTIIEYNAAGSPGLVRARSSARTGADVLGIAQEINDHVAVEWAQSDRIFWARRMGTLPPNDPMFGQQWALEQPNDEDMDALAAWAITTGDPAIRVVVLDSGIQQDHPDIHQIAGQSFTGTGSNGGPGNSCDNHGTAVAGCVAARINNGIGIVGIAPDTLVQAGKIFNEISFFGFCLPFLESQDSWTTAGINWAASSGARVTNSSWGGGGASAAITTAFNSTRAQGVIHFGAAGNDGTSTISFPANLQSVNAVAALASTGNRASFSTYGVGLFISAPGAAVLTTDRTGSAGYASGDYVSIDGTSFASPYAAGVAALVLSANPGLTPAEVEAILASTAVDKGTPGYNTDFGWGFINAGAAVAAVAGSPCLADLNGDGQVDFFDVNLFLNAFANQDPIADFNDDGSFDFFDVNLFLNAFSEGCP